MNKQFRALSGALLAVGSLSCAAHAADELVWIEGESAAKKTVFDNAGLNSVDTSELSGGAWLSSFSEPNTPVGTATYDVAAPQAGKYNFWVRSNPSGSGLSYRVDGGEWKVVDANKLRDDKSGAPRVLDNRQVSLSGEPGFVVLQWMNVGALDLTAGHHTIEFSLGGIGEGARFNALDCFVLAPGDFAPNAKFKAGENWTNLISFKPGQTWDFAPPTDTFSPNALLDLRSLNEKVAGEHGFIRQSADGADFVRGDGQPIRFWGGSDYTQRDLDVDGVARHARFLAKRGVNIVRWHGDLPLDNDQAARQKLANPQPGDVDEKELDEAFKLVAGMKREGIYTILSPYWGIQPKAFPGWNMDDSPNFAGLVFFHPKVQEAYKGYLRALYTRKNPYTGIALKDDPAVAIIQLQNEDSMLFYTFQNVKGEPLRILRTQYGAWLKKKYGTLEKAQAAWKGYKADDDDFANNLPGMFIVWEFTGDARRARGTIAGREERLSDQLQFMAQTQFNFNAEIKRFLRDDLGCKQLVNAGNWRTVDQTLVDDAERWSYTANEVIGKNVYYGGHHRGINEGWQILPGHVFSSPSATLAPETLPVNVRQVQGHPFIIPESLWVHPTKYESEGPLMVAAQTSLTGVDTFYWFANGVPEWQSPGTKWTYATPMQLGQFPASALLYRQGFLKRATQPVVSEQKPLTSIWGRQEPLIAEERAYDPNRDVGGKSVGPVNSAVDPLAFVAGPVVVNYGGNAKNTRVADLSKLINREKKTVRSVTGEISTDYGRGLYTVNAPRVQAATGFLGRAGTVALKDVFVRCDNEYASITVVPLDTLPLATSGKVLVQIGTVARPTGWVERPMKFQADKQLLDGFRIVDTGRGPWQVERASGVVTIRNRKLTRATALDANGVAQGSVEVQKTGNGLRVTLPPNALYVVLQ